MEKNNAIPQDVRTQLAILLIGMKKSDNSISTIFLQCDKKLNFEIHSPTLTINAQDEDFVPYGQMQIKLPPLHIENGLINYFNLACFIISELQIKINSGMKVKRFK